jgi:multidrug efflux pump subunit AcrA (membrane-fusion protein)
MLFQVVRPATWAALSALLLLLGVLAAWGFYGTVTTMVSGQGILLREGARVDASSPGSGRLEAIFVDIDDSAGKGQVIARLAQPALRHQIAEMRGRVEILRAERAMGTEMGADKKMLESEYLARRRQALNPPSRSPGIVPSRCGSSWSSTMPSPRKSTSPVPNISR